MIGAGMPAARAGARRSLLVASLAVAAASCGSRPAEPPALEEGASEATDFRFRPEQTLLPGDSCELPVRFVRELAFLDAALDGGEAASFLLDTGFGMCVITPEYARARGLAVVLLEGGASVESATGASRGLERALRIDSLRIGELELRGLDAGVMDFGAVQATLDFELAGVIGFPTFAELSLTIDWPAGAVRVSREGLGKQDGADVLPYVLDDGVPALEVEIAARRFSLLVDSGSNARMSLPPEALDLAWAYGPVPFSRLATATGDSERVRFGRLAGDVHVGRHVLRRPIAMVGDGVGHIGAGIWKHFALTFDQRGGRIRVARDSTEPLEFESWRGIGVGYATVDGVERVADVVPGGPADRSGLAPGDVVLARRTTPFDEETGTCGDVHRHEAGVEGEFYCLRRGVQTLHVTVPIGDLIP